MSVRSFDIFGNLVKSGDSPPTSGILTSGPFLFSVLALLAVITAWSSSWILPPSVMARLAEQQTGFAMGVDQLESIESRRWIGYLAAPVALATRAALAALVIQGIGMLTVTELGFSTAFRASVAGGFAMMYGSWMNLAWLWRVGPDSLSLDVLGVSPVSLAGLLMSPEGSRAFFYRAAAEVSLTAVFWITLVGLTLQADSRLTWKSGLAVGMVAWLVMATVRIGLSAVLSGLVPGS